MTIEDIPEAMQLKDAAGWNQTTADWARFLSASPEGCFVAEREGRVVGTSTSIVYEGRFAWIGMVIVDSQYRCGGNWTFVPL
jgi:Acetyltransferase (GNAT) family